MLEGCEALARAQVDSDQAHCIASAGGMFLP